ncbi:MAG: hypothetical protein GOV15_04405, partial [Candidatus Diapherotrites archaeon]|nr:hypothetical protein [Candidatus Diapherotrites archaeon]
KEHVLERDVKITDLKEGTIIAEFIYEVNAKGKKTIKREKMNIKGLVKQLELEKDKNVKLIANPHEAAGITQKNLTYLKKLVKQKKVKNKVRVQESIPFVPVFLLGYLVSAVVGDAAWAFIL